MTTDHDDNLPEFGGERIDRQQLAKVFLDAGSGLEDRILRSRLPMAIMDALLRHFRLGMRYYNEEIVSESLQLLAASAAHDGASRLEALAAGAPHFDPDVAHVLDAKGRIMAQLRRRDGDGENGAPT